MPGHTFRSPDSLPITRETRLKRSVFISSKGSVKSKRMAEIGPWTGGKLTCELRFEREEGHKPKEKSITGRDRETKSEEQDKSVRLRR